MVSSEDRILRMEDEGVLSSEQAAMLRQSFESFQSVEAGESGPALRRYLPYVGIAIVALAIIVYLIFPFEDADVGTIQDVSRSLNQPGGYGEMNKSVSGILGALVLLIVPLIAWVWLHNSLVSKEERVFKAWAQTESNLQRRGDLIPVLIETVSRYLRHEKDTLEGVTGKRSEGTAALAKAIDALAKAQKESVSILKGQGRALLEKGDVLKSLLAAQTQVGGRISAIVAIAEQYPDLRSSDQFLELQAQLEGTENRINLARIRFNEAVSDYNGAIRRMPGSLVARAGGFRRKAYFQSEAEARRAPEFKIP